MAQKKKRKASAVDVVAAQYARAFQGIRADIASFYAQTMKFLAEEQSRQIKVLSEKPFWLDAKYFVQAREEAGLSQENLAGMILVSRAVIANIEAGIRVATVGIADKIYTALAPLGGISAKNGLRAVIELDRETQRRSIELREKWLAGMSVQLEADKQKLAQTDAEILRLDQAVVGNSGNAKWGR